MACGSGARLRKASPIRREPPSSSRTRSWKLLGVAMLEADYVIVGAGSAGCALAYRLSEDGKHRVLVLEYGGTDIGPLIQMPAAFSIPMNLRAYDWGYRTEPEPHLGGRRLATPRGKVIGGS